MVNFLHNMFGITWLVFLLLVCEAPQQVVNFPQNREIKTMGMQGQNQSLHLMLPSMATTSRLNHGLDQKRLLSQPQWDMDIYSCIGLTETEPIADESLGSTLFPLCKLLAKLAWPKLEFVTHTLSPLLIIIHNKCSIQCRITITISYRDTILCTLIVSTQKSSFNSSWRF